MIKCVALISYTHVMKSANILKLAQETHTGENVKKLYGSSQKEGYKLQICSYCQKEVFTNYQSIETKRKSKIIICSDCLKQTQRKEVDSARDSK